MNRIKQLIKFIKNHSGETILVIGTGLFIRNVFNFSYRTYGKGGGLKIGIRMPELEGIAYYYTSNVLMGISIGAMLIVTGILIIKRSK